MAEGGLKVGSRCQASWHGTSSSVLSRAAGWQGLTRGWAPTLVGYSIQGAGKYG